MLDIDRKPTFVTKIINLEIYALLRARISKYQCKQSQTKWQLIEDVLHQVRYQERKN